MTKKGTTYINRLRAWATYLRTVSREHFDMGSYIGDPDKHPCQSTACALGWAAVRFRRHLGFSSKWGGFVYLRRDPEIKGVDAASAFFGLNRFDADDLVIMRICPVTGNEITTPKQAAASIERLARRHEKEGFKKEVEW